MLYSIGYSNRTLPEFLNELGRRNITQLWDVRSRPRSRNWPFNASQIEIWSEREGILYRQYGSILGGASGILSSDPSYLEILERMMDVGATQNLAIMCTEGDPALCHRSSEIGQALLVRYGTSLRNILRDGSDEGIEQTLLRIDGRLL